MSYFHFDVYSDFFTPQEFPVEILELAKSHDVIPCCLPPPAKNFLVSMLLKEYYYKSNGLSVYIRDDEAANDEKETPINSESGQVGVKELILNAEECLKSYKFPFETLSSLSVTVLKSEEDFNEATLSLPSVIFCSRSTFRKISFKYSQFFKKNLNLLIIDNVHKALTCRETRQDLTKIITRVRKWNEEIRLDCKKIRLVFLSVSLLHFYGSDESSKNFWRMEETFRKLEKFTSAKIDTSSDLVSLLRYSFPPKERIITFGPVIHSHLCLKIIQEVKGFINEFRSFLNSHRFNPAASLGYTYNEYQELVKIKPPPETNPTNGEEGEREENDTDSLAEELRKIPHPKTEPLRVLNKFETILDNLGPWCANRAIFLLTNEVIDLKVQVPYVRHYLLLGALYTRLQWIQSLFESTFSSLHPLTALESFSSPKLVGILQLLRRAELTRPSSNNDGTRAKGFMNLSMELGGSEEEESDEEGGTVASYLERQKVVEMGGGGGGGGRGGGRFHGRRRHYRARFPNKSNDKIGGGGGGGAKDKSKIPPSENSEQSNKLSETDVLNSSPLTSTTTTTSDTNSNMTSNITTTTSDTSRNMTSNVTTTSDTNSNMTSNVTSTSDSVTTSNATTASPQQKSRGRYSGRGGDESLCGLILCEDPFNARLLYHFLVEASDSDKSLAGLAPAIALPSSGAFDRESREGEREYKRREESLRKFRYREANLLVGTSLLEDGIELPKANLVVRFEPPPSFRSYLFSKGRAQSSDAEFFIFIDGDESDKCLAQLSSFKIVEEILLSHSILPPPQVNGQNNELVEEEILRKFPIFKSASLTNSISIINRYCARLPSDTFTRLTPTWKIVKNEQNGGYKCSLRLPINSPVKWTVEGIEMPSERLAKKVVALQMSVILHGNGELDDSLLPVGKEGVVQEVDLNVGLQITEEEYGEFRPGSTRRRQYYDKQLAPPLTHSLPSSSLPPHLYWVKLVLTCPLPEEQNTRGRALHPPQLASQSFGILLRNEIPPLPAFPIYTRCGEVTVELVKVDIGEDFELTEEKLEKISAFHHFTFTSVLRLDKYLTLFDPAQAENSYFVVPLSSSSQNEAHETTHVSLDWAFISKIYEERHSYDKDLGVRTSYSFKAEDYLDAVVTPWYRNYDTPQFFYVAEICTNLTPESQFPGCEYKTFEEYYTRKYSLKIRDSSQPLLDVDHTSARLNFLTPRYVNRKGMALPTSSETTKKAKRENLEQKQILVPELCAVHPFSGSLWRQAVCLPCILYRINSLLLADSIRSLVASEVMGLGVSKVPPSHKWDTLNFGWSLQDVFGIPIAENEPPKNTNNLKIEPVEAVVVKVENIQISPSANEESDKNTKVESEESSSKIEKDVMNENESDGIVNSKKDNEKEEIGEKVRNCESEKPTEEIGEKLKNGQKEKENESESKNEKNGEKEEEKELSGFEKAAKEAKSAGMTFAESLLLNDKKHAGKSVNEILSEEMRKCRVPELEVGTWSNEMASGIHLEREEVEEIEEEEEEEEEDELLDPNVALPSNLMMLDKNWTWGGRSKLFNHRVHRALYGSPTHWGEVWDRGAFDAPEDTDSSSHKQPNDEDETGSLNSDTSGDSDESFCENNYKISFTGNEAEALDKRKYREERGRGIWDGGMEREWWPIEEEIEEEEEKKTRNEEGHEEEDDLMPSEEEEEVFGLDFERETELRRDFEERARGKLGSIGEILRCEDISQLPPRVAPKKEPIEENEDREKNENIVIVDEKYQKLFDENTRLKPPIVLDEPAQITKMPQNPSLSLKISAKDAKTANFSFDESPEVSLNFGPSPCTILQALTMSNANDGLNLERLETVGDSFLKYAITSYLFCTYDNIHEGKLSHLRSKQVSNVHLYRLGRRRGLGGFMVSAKFEPHDNWLPPCYHIPKDLDKALIQSQAHNFSMAQVNALKDLPPSQIQAALQSTNFECDETEFIPYNLVTQQSIPDKSLADCVEALIGAYLTSVGPFRALLFMSWLGMRVLPCSHLTRQEFERVKKSKEGNVDEFFYMKTQDEGKNFVVFERLSAPKSPLLLYRMEAREELSTLLKGYDNFEAKIGYSFRDKSYLLQAFTHASYSANTLTDCYQRLEFLGDAILDYLITRHLYEDPRQHSPGSLTDLRSALVNNTIFASLAVKNGFHKYFRHASPGLTTVLQKFISFQEQHAHTLTQDYYLMGEEECDEAEDIEVPKALGDVFESVAGAIFLDSGMSLDAVWNVYYNIMKSEIEQFSENVPKSPIRELLELEPETAKFGKPEKLWDGRRVRVSVEIFSVGIFRGIGRNYRIAKCTAAKCALRHLKRLKSIRERSK